MANNSEKKTVIRNKQKLVISCCFFFYMLWRLFRGTLTGTAYFVFLVNALFQFIPLIYTYYISRPIYDNGTLVDCGSDLSQEGLLDYVHDILYMSSFIQFLASFSFFAMYLYILIIGYTIYLVINITNNIPGFASPPQGNVQPKQKKQKIKVRNY
ncbi:Transmembrane protein 208 [Entamoeba marina]